MSKTPKPGTDVISARVQREQEWAWSAYVAGYPYPAIRAMSILPPEEGGLGYALSLPAIRAGIDAQRTAQGQIIGTRDERIERRQMRYDQMALDAQRAMREARDVGALDVHAAKLLLEVSEAEARMHGDNAAQRIEADITTHDAVVDELNAMLARAGRDPVPTD